MRLYIISLCLAAAFLLPSLSEPLDFSLGAFHAILGIPAIGLDYMRVFFHELGHCVTFWLFGYPSVPSFDFEYGGGVTYPVLGRIWIVQGGVFAAMAAGLYYLCRPDGVLFNNERYPLLGVAIALTLLHLSLAFNDGHEVMISFMGYGAEIILGVFCIARAILGLTLYGTVERYLNMVFGLFVIGTNVALLSGLIYSDIIRSAYSLQKGGEMMGDFDKIAETLDITVQSVARGSLSYMVVMLIIGIAGIWWWKAKITSAPSSPAPGKKKSRQHP